MRACVCVCCIRIPTWTNSSQTLLDALQVMNVVSERTLLILGGRKGALGWDQDAAGITPEKHKRKTSAC